MRGLGVSGRDTDESAMTRYQQLILFASFDISLAAAKIKMYFHTHIQDLPLAILAPLHRAPAKGDRGVGLPF
jgi:hypothetical protein